MDKLTRLTYESQCARSKDLGMTEYNGHMYVIRATPENDVKFEVLRLDPVGERQWETSAARIDEDLYHAVFETFLRQYEPNPDMEFDELGHPLAGVCGDSMSWKMINADTIQFEGFGEMDDYGPDCLPPWHMHEITNVEIEDGVMSVGRNAFSRHLTNAHIMHVSIPDSIIGRFEALCGFDDDDYFSVIDNKED